MRTINQLLSFDLDLLLDYLGVSDFFKSIRDLKISPYLKRISCFLLEVVLLYCALVLFFLWEEGYFYFILNEPFAMRSPIPAKLDRLQVSLDIWEVA